MSETLNPCPFCQERIQPLATKCRYCKEMLPEGWSNRPDVPSASSNAISRVPSVSARTPISPNPSTAPSKPMAGYATPAGVLALIAAILALIIPVIGVLWFSPIAILLGIAALRGGAKGYGIAVLVIVTVNMIISPTFWLNIGAGSTMPGAGGNRIITYINVFGVLGMVLMLFSGRLWTSAAAIAIGIIAVGLYSIIKRPWFKTPEALPPPTVAPVAPLGSRPPSTGPNSRASKDDSCVSPRSDRVIILADNAHDTYVGTTHQREGAPSGTTLGFGGWGDRYVAFIRFNIPASLPARSAVLCLFATTVPPNDPRLVLSRVVAPWDPASVTISSIPESATGLSTGDLNTRWNAFAITKLYHFWVQHPDSNFGIQLAPTRTDQTNGAFASSEYPDQQYRPRIVVTLSTDLPADPFHGEWQVYGTCLQIVPRANDRYDVKVRYCENLESTSTELTGQRVSARDLEVSGLLRLTLTRSADTVQVAASKPISDKLANQLIGEKETLFAARNRFVVPR